MSMLTAAIRRLLRSRSLILSILLVTYTKTHVVRSQEIGTQAPPSLPIERLVKDADDRLPKDFTAIFDMRISAVWFDLQQGEQISRCTFTSNGGVQGLTIKSEFPADPVYRPSGTRGYESIDFDDDGNLIVWRSLEKKALRTPDINRVYVIQQLNIVAPGGKVLERSSHLHVYEYAPGNENSIYESMQMRLATGRFFSGHINEYKSERVRPDGLLEVTAEGSYGNGLAGEWNLVMVPGPAPLVREAALRVGNLETPALRVVTRDVMIHDGFSLAAGGTLYFSENHRIEIALRDYRPGKPDLDHLKELRDYVANPIPEGTAIVDFTGPKPRRYVISGSGDE